jgi:hypothetical protein
MAKRTSKRRALWSAGTGRRRFSSSSLFFLELLNTVARRWLWPAQRISQTAEWLLAAGFRVQEAPLHRVAYWAGQGLTAYDACYVALADERRMVVITADERILAVAGDFARSLASLSA